MQKKLHSYLARRGREKHDIKEQVRGLPFLITQPSLALKPAQKGRLWGQTVAVTGRLEQLDLGDHLKLLQRPSQSQGA